MSGGTLNPSVVDVFLRAYDQTPGDRSGPSGRLTDLQNGVVTHYNPGNGQPQRIKIQQRNGFKTLTTNGHDSGTGAPNNPAWNNPELLASIGGQLLSIANSVPRVYDGDDWTNYAAERVVVNQLSSDVMHTSQRTLMANDHAIKGGVRAEVWTEQFDPSTTAGGVYVGFRGSDGAWIRTPSLLYDASADSIISRGQVIADASADFFWVVVNEFITSANAFKIYLFDLNGQQKSTTTLNKVWEENSGYWDVRTLNGGGIYIAQPLHTKASATDGVRFTKITQSGGVIAGGVTVDNSDMHCRGPVQWMTNDLGDGLYYLATVGHAETDGGAIWGYQVDLAPGTALHEFDFEVFPAGDIFPDSLIGFAHDSGIDDEPDLFVSFTVLSTPAQTLGAPYDPQRRFSQCNSCAWDNTVTLQRQNDFTLQQSRAFKHDDEYYSINYYQSGSGNQITETQIDVDFTVGDYMIGSPVQPVVVRAGDYTEGSTHTLVSVGDVVTTGTQGPLNIEAGDTVELVTSDGTNPNWNGRPLAPAGVSILKWTFANLTIGGSSLGRLHINASTGVAGANGDWDVLRFDNVVNAFYTVASKVTGGTLTPGTFNHAGQFSTIDFTFYALADLPTFWPLDTIQFLPAGQIVVSVNPTSGNNGTFTIVRVGFPQGTVSDFSLFGFPGIWVATTTQSNDSGGFTAAVSTAHPDRWHFGGEFVDAADEGSDLVITNDTVNGSNNIQLEITAASAHNLTVPAGAVIAEMFKPPFLTAQIDVINPRADGSCTFFLQDVDPDYSYLGGLIIITSDSTHSQNNGVYQIVDVGAPGSHLLYAVPTNGKSDQRNQFFHADEQGISIVLRANVSPEFQPTWFMVPLTGTKPVVGCFERGIAFADWRFEGQTPVANTSSPNPFPCAVTSAIRDTTAWTWVLPYRAVSFTVGQTIVTASGQIVNAAIASNASTVGIKQFTLSDEPGIASVTADESASEMLLPGPMCAEFTASGFHEQGVNLGFEAPFVVSQYASSSGASLTKEATYQVIAVAEVTDEDGDRVFSIPSPPLNFTLTGTSDSINIGGRLLQPLDTNGVPVLQHYGITNWTLLGISLYSTAIQDGVPTTEHHKITLDLNVNGLAPYSATNPSGFTFPDEFTWNFKFEMPDATFLPAEILYIDKGYLPRFPAPAQRGGVFWKNRSWVIGYDGAIWMSGEKKEGDATWFFPLFRFVLPTVDKPVAIAELDDYLIIGCGRSIWYIPSATFPDATGRNGSLPAAVELPFTNGCTGLMQTLHSGAAYSSTAGGVWIVTRGLENKWLSQPVQDQLGQIPISAMAVDERQRLHVTGNGGFMLVYDQVVQQWSYWTLATAGVSLLSVLNGDTVFQDAERVWIYDTSLFADNRLGVLVGIALDFTLSSLNFSNVRGLKSVWEIQIVGDYKGEHNLNAILSYPDDDPENPTIFPASGKYTPDPDLPYLMAINPMIEQASSYGLRIFTDFVGITVPGNSAEFELLSCEVGIESRTGLNKFPDNRRIQGR